jgi:glycosyltransferase involved in cell wall biosynthesis
VRIGVDLTPASHVLMGGTETYILNLLASLETLDGQNEYVIYCRPENQDLFRFVRPNFLKVRIPSPLGFSGFLLRATRKLARVVLKHDYFSRFLSRQRLDVAFFPLTAMPVGQLAPPCIITIHDIQHEYFPQFFSSKELRIRRACARNAIRKSRMIIVLSEFTRETVLSKFGIPPSQVVTIPHGVGAAFCTRRDATDATLRDKYRLPSDFVLYPANSWPHKNHARLLEAAAALKRQGRLRCALVFTGFVYEARWRVLRQVEELGLSSHALHLGFVDPIDLPALYRAARGLIFPSLFEGFGLPILEAMRSGCPIACSNSTSLPEVAGEAALLFDPEDVGAIADAIYQLSENETLRQQLVERGLARAEQFTWERAAELTLSVLKSCRE